VSTVVFAPTPTARPPRLQRLAVTLVVLAIWASAGFGVVVVTFVAAPTVVGRHSFTVLSGSMEPTLHVGDVVIDRKVQVLDVRPGDIVTFRDPDGATRLLTHRVVQMRVAGSTAYVVTKGDANTGVERWSIPVDGTVGLVEFRLPKLGHVLSRLEGRDGRLLLIAVPALLLGLVELKRLWLPKDRHEH
jgi:signal peptidase I